LADMADVFFNASVTEHLGEGATVTTTEAAAGSIKAEQRRPHPRRKKKNCERPKKREGAEKKEEKLGTERGENSGISDEKPRKSFS